MSYIKTIDEQEAQGKLKLIYDKIKKADHPLKSMDMIHSLRPDTVESNIIFTQSVISATDNKIPNWLIDALGVYVGYLNGSEYCIEHHFANLKKHLNNNQRAEQIRGALAENDTGSVLDVWEQAIMNYAEKLVKTPATINEENIEELRLCGLKDEEILEVAQIVSFFCYKNRIALGLGISLEDHIFGKPTK